MKIKPGWWRSAAGALTAWLLSGGLALAGVVWVEQDPPGAGDLVTTAQVTLGSGALDGIKGTLKAFTPQSGNPVYQVDVYKTFISDFAGFSAKTVSSNPDDTALFLFDDSGHGVYMNDDNGVDLLSLLPSGDPNGPAANAFYYLAIGLGGMEAFDAGSLALFLAGSFTDVRAGNPAAGALASWDATFSAAFEQPLDYEIVLTGAQVAAIPEPASALLALLALASLMLSRSRTRAARGLS